MAKAGLTLPLLISGLPGDKGRDTTLPPENGNPPFTLPLTKARPPWRGSEVGRELAQAAHGDCQVPAGRPPGVWVSTSPHLPASASLLKSGEEPPSYGCDKGYTHYPYEARTVGLAQSGRSVMTAVGISNPPASEGGWGGRGGGEV